MADRPRAGMGRPTQRQLRGEVKLEARVTDDGRIRVSCPEVSLDAAEARELVLKINAALETIDRREGVL